MYMYVIEALLFPPLCFCLSLSPSTPFSLSSHPPSLLSICLSLSLSIFSPSPSPYPSLLPSPSISSDQFIVFSGGAPHDLVDGDSITVWDGKETTTLQLTSPVKGMHIIEDVQSDMDSGIVGASSEMDNVTTGTSNDDDVIMM